MKTPHSSFTARVLLLRVLLLGLLICGSRSGWAAPVTADQAAAVVRGWLKADGAPLGEVMANAPVQGVEAFNDKSGAVLCYVVSLQPAGFVIVPADDLVEPIIAFSSQATFDSAEGNPLVAMLNDDLPGRLAAARDPAALALNADVVQAQGKWKQFEQLDADPLATPNQLGSISDVRVSPLLAAIQWSQGSISGACFNYYTPNNYICGCVATAFAQLLYYHQYPTTGVGTASFSIKVDGTSTTRKLRGGDGAGGPYNYSLMPTVPSSSTSTASRQAVGALTADCGVSVNMEYTSSASGAYVYKISDRLKGTFHYSNSVTRRDTVGWGPNIGAGLNGMVNPNLDARLPVIFEITGNPSPGSHCVVCDGYGYNSSTLYHHLKMGWLYGRSDAWYALPLVDNTYFGTFNLVDDCVYNVYETGSGEIISGRVFYAGVPAAGATVTATRTGGGTYTATTDANGIYALAKIPSASTYSIIATKPGYASTSANYSTGTSSDGNTSSGNVWGANFTLVASGPPTISSAGRALWDMSKVVVAYSEPVSPGTAANVGNYSINNGVTVTGAAMGATSSSVVLSTAGFPSGTACLLSVQNVQDLNGNTIVPVQVSIGVYPNVALWLKADAGVTANGSGQVTAWTDQSGKGNNASASLSTAPLYVANAVGGHPALRFDGTSQYLTSPNSSSLAIVGDLTIYAVANINVTDWSSVANEIGFVGKTAGAAGNMPASYDYYLSRSTGLPRLYRGNGTVADFANATATASIGGPHLFSVVMSGTSVAHYLDSQINGTGTISTTLGDGGTELGIGSRHDLSPKMKGDMAEVIICSSALSDADRASMDSYLSAKYAISVGSLNARYFYGSSGCSGGGGSGLWDTTTANWRPTNDGTCPGNTTFAAADDAIFGGAAGSVTIPTISNPLTANRIQVNTGGYHFAISLTSGQFRTSLTTGRFTVTSGVTAINQQSSSRWTLLGAPGGTLYFDGAGTVDFADPYTGVWTDVVKEHVTGGGTLIIRGGGPEPSAPGSFLADYYKLDNGSTLYFAGYGPSYGANVGLTLGTTGAGGGRIQVDSGQTVTFGAPVTGAGGLTQAGAGTVVLSANSSSTFSGPVTVNGGTLNAAAAGSLGSGNATVVSGVLKLSSASAMSASANLILPSAPAAGSVNLNFSGAQTVATLSFGATKKAAGTWGASGSGATYTDAAFSGAGILTVTVGGQAATTTVLTGSGSPASYGASVTFTATVNGSAPTGTVQFRDGGGNLGSAVALSGGQARLAISTLSVSGSPHSISAIYSGDANNGGSTSSALSQTVTPAPLSITANSPSKAYGQTLTFAGTEFAASGLQNGEMIGTVTITASGGTAANSAVGTYTLTPSAAAGGTFNPATYTISYHNGTLTVTAASSATELSSSLNPSGLGSNVTFTATVSSAAGTPAGNVVFSANAVAFSTNALVSGSTSASTAALPFGASTVLAQYAAQGNFLASSDTLQQVVTNLTRYFYGSSGCSGGGGSGLWDTATANWRATDDGICPGNSSFPSGDDAIFGGAAGSVTIPTINNPLTANRIEVQTGGYHFAISLTSGQFRTDLASGRFTVDSGVTTINQQRSGVWTLFGAPGGTLYVDGAGTLDFADPATGVYLTVLKEYVTGGGTFIIRSSGPEPSTPGSFLADYYTLDNGSTLYMAGYSPTYGANQGLTLGTAGAGGGTIQVDSGKTVTFNAPVTGAGGLTLAGAGTLVLSGDSSATFSGPVTVNGGTLNAAAAGSLGSGDAEVVSGVLKLSSAAALNASAGLTLPDSPAAGSVNLNFSGAQTVAALAFGPAQKVAGTWGALGSSATYTDAAFIGSGILNVTTGPTTTTSLSGSGSPASYGDTVTFTATVDGDSPTGTVQFQDGGANLGAPVALSDSQAELDISTLSVSGSPHSITAVYSGDANNGGSASSALSQAITAATVVPSVAVADKVYDGTTSATITSLSLAGVVNGDEPYVNLAGGTAVFLDKNAGTGKTVNVTGLTLAGSLSGNYVLSSSSLSTNASISARPVTVTAATHSRPYDCTTHSAGTPALTLGTLAPGDTAVWLQSFDSPSVGSRTLMPAGTVNDGNGGLNYAVTYASVSGSITCATVVPSVVVANKVYDGTTSATITRVSLAGVIGGDEPYVSLAGGAAVFLDKNAGANKTVNVTGLTLAGSLSGNYVLSSASLTANANITRRPTTFCPASSLTTH